MSAAKDLQKGSFEKGVVVPDVCGAAQRVGLCALLSWISSPWYKFVSLN